MSLSVEQRGFYNKHIARMDDWQLLQEFVVGRDEKAFETLVRRHAGLVHGVALRHVKDAGIAEEVAQAVFMLLARKAAGLRKGTVLSGWLFQTTRFVAQRALRCEQRRQRREQEALAMQEQLTPQAEWDRIAPEVDEALGELNRADRDALLLRFFEGRSLREVGGGIGVSEEAAKKRVSRGLEKVRAILTRKGVGLSVAALGACMAEQAKAGVATELVTRLSSGALNLSPVQSAAATLAEEVVAAWRWAKLKTAAAIGGAAVCVGLLSLWIANQGAAPLRNRIEAQQGEAGAVAAGRPAQERARAATGLAEVNAMRLRFRAVDAATGEGIAQARVAYTIWTNWKVEDHPDVLTDAAGECAISYPSEAGRLDVGVVQDGYAARFARWPSEGLTGIPVEYTLRLERVTNSIGGQIVDAEGRPVANAAIWFQAEGTGDYTQRERPRERFGFLHKIPATSTDGQGRWFVKFIPPQHPGFFLKARHPDFADTFIISSDAQPSLEGMTREGLRELWAGKLVTRMDPAFSLTGRVVDERGGAVTGAKIQEREQGEVFSTDHAGTFRVPKLPAGPRSFTISAEGYAPERRAFEVGNGMQPVVVTLQTGAVLRLRVVDEQGMEVPGASVVLEQWGEDRHALEWRANTDGEGRLEWSSAPRNVVLELVALKDGFTYARNIRVKADGEEHVIRMSHALEVYGRVVDGGTGRGIRDFKAVPGYGGYGISEDRWFAGSTVRGTNGMFKLTLGEGRKPWWVRVMADGYEDWTSDVLTNDLSVTLEIALKRAVSEEAVRGVVLTRDGRPASGAQVALLTFEHNARLSPKRVMEGNKRWLVKSDENGWFCFPANKQAHSVAAVSREGYAHLRVRDFHEPVTLRLQAFGRVEGVVDASAREHPVEDIYLYDPAGSYGGRVSLLGSYTAKVDGKGRFVFENVPPGEFSVFINSGLGIPFHHQTPIVVKPGETTHVVITARPGTKLSGRFVAPKDRAIAWAKDLVTAQLYAEPADSPLAGVPAEERAWRELEFYTSRAGREYVNTPRVYSVRVREDGSFVSLEGLAPGHYRFTTVFKEASATRDVVIPEEQPAELRLGEIEVR